MSSVRAIAKHAGVSVATVSRALNDHPHVDPDTRRKVLDASRELGEPATAASRRLATVIGLVYPGEVVRPDYGSFDAALLSGILRGVNEHRFDVKILSIHRDKSQSESYTQFFARKGLRGAILRTFEDTRSVCELIAGEGFPAVVVADRFAVNPKVNFISCDSFHDSRRAVEHLLALGHRRIALGVHSIADTDHTDRRRGYEAAHHEAGLPIEPSLLTEIIGSMEGGAGLITRLMSMTTPPTALMLTDPLATFGALRRCLELGIRLPIDLSIVGFDDSDMRRHTFPACTAICQDAETLGLEAARWLTRFLATGESPSLRSLRQTTFEINQTTGVPPRDPVRVLPDGSRVPVAGASKPGRASKR
jgi:DNA-binding LacI/PurR family transcriptional regulator